METCFVIQPFDSGKYDKRFIDVYCPAIEAAGFKAYRVDKDPRVSIPIDAIEDGIRKAVICLADITTNNPNVWYELGFAFAMSKPVVMVCSEERREKKYPFDIQHRSIIRYSVQSTSDFDRFRQELTTKLQATEKKNELLHRVTEFNVAEPFKGLSSDEIKVLAVLARKCSVLDSTALLHTTIQEAENVGITDVTLKLAIKGLKEQDYITLKEGYPFSTIKLNDKAWSWIKVSLSQFVLS